MTFRWTPAAIVMQLFGSIQCSCLFLLMNCFPSPMWLFKPFKLLNDAINPGITTGKVNYGSRLETLQRECASSVSGSHTVSMNTHVASVCPHSQFTQTFIKSLRIHIYSNTHAITYTHVDALLSPRTRRGQWTLCSVDFFLVTSEHLISWLFIYFYPERTKVWLVLLLWPFQCHFLVSHVNVFLIFTLIIWVLTCN